MPQNCHIGNTLVLRPLQCLSRSHQLLHTAYVSLFILFLTIGSSLLCGCFDTRTPSVYFRHKTFADTHWLTNSELSFEVPQEDSTQFISGYYRMYILVRYNDNFPWNELYINLETESLHNGITTYKDIRLNMTNSNAAISEHTHQRKLKVLRESLHPIATEYISPGWSLSLTADMTPDSIPGIYDIGLLLRPVNK